MGYPYMMFTKKQGKELIDNTTSEWVTINNINGRKFTNKTDSSKYIFIPGGGWYSDHWLNNAGSIVFGWSTTIDTSDASEAWSIYISSNYISMDNNSISRNYGCPIRPVAPKRPW